MKRILKLGYRGKSVKELQTILGITPDGHFGPKTEASVKEFQRSKGLTVDGIVGNETWTFLIGERVSDVHETGIPQPTTSGGYDKLEGHVPDYVIKEIPSLEKFGINTPLRLAHFLAQCGHESGNFKFKVENLNYSVSVLKRVFRKYFPGELANEYARKPKKIGSRVYGNRMGNGDESSGEGYKFRGRGYIQLTGKNNYKSFGNDIEVDLIKNPDLVSEKYPLLSAAWFFHKNNLNSISDRGVSPDVVKSVTRRVNGGTNGLKDRQNKFVKFYNLLK